MHLFQKILNLLPIKRDKIVFINFNGRGYGCNPKYIAKELLRQGAGYDLVWLVSDLNIELPEGIRPVKIYSRRARVELATAGVIVSNVKNGPSFEKKKTQYYIQTWHGDFALKYIEGEAESSLTPEYLAISKADSQKTDLVLSGSISFSDIVRRSFWYDGEIFESGLPRNDIFFEKDSDMPQLIRKQMGIPIQADIALYAPTFRDDGGFFPFPDFLAVIDSLERVTGREWVFVVRLHPKDQRHAAEIHFSSKLFDGSSLADMQELEKAADLLITDYSSLMCDFMLQQKPVVLYTPDLDEYRAQSRGLRPIFDELPFMRTFTDIELQNAIPHVFSAEYSKIMETFLRDQLRCFDDGHASERVVERIRQVISNDA